LVEMRKRSFMADAAQKPINYTYKVP